MLSVLYVLQKIAFTQLKQQNYEKSDSLVGTPKSLTASITSQPAGAHTSVHTSLNNVEEEPDQVEWEEGLELTARPALSRSMIIRKGRNEIVLGKEEECLLRNLMESDRSNSLI